MSLFSVHLTSRRSIAHMCYTCHAIRRWAWRNLLKCDRYTIFVGIIIIIKRHRAQKPHTVAKMKTTVAQLWRMWVWAVSVATAASFPFFRVEHHMLLLTANHAAVKQHSIDGTNKEIKIATAANVIIMQNAKLWIEYEKSTENTRFCRQAANALDSVENLFGCPDMVETWIEHKITCAECCASNDPYSWIHLNFTSFIFGRNSAPFDIKLNERYAMPTFDGSQNQCGWRTQTAFEFCASVDWNDVDADNDAEQNWTKLIWRRHLTVQIGCCVIACAFYRHVWRSVYRVSVVPGVDAARTHTPILLV